MSCVSAPPQKGHHCCSQSSPSHLKEGPQEMCSLQQNSSLDWLQQNIHLFKPAEEVLTKKFMKEHSIKMTPGLLVYSQKAYESDFSHLIKSLQQQSQCETTPQSGDTNQEGNCNN